MNYQHQIKRRKKLIEIAIPLEIINSESAREKCIRHGHPSTMHLWWSRKPTAIARTILFCQMVDDPSDLVEEFPSFEAQNKERERLFRLMNKLSKWEVIKDYGLLSQANKEIKKSWIRCCKDNKNHPHSKEIFNPDNMPGIFDPFSGGGSIPLEAQRLGLKSYAAYFKPVPPPISLVGI